MRVAEAVLYKLHFGPLSMLYVEYSSLKMNTVYCYVRLGSS